jgi:hypothetical protein
MKEADQEFGYTWKMCYKLYTSPLFLRGQGARRRITASAYLNQNGSFYKPANW